MCGHVKFALDIQCVVALQRLSDHVPQPPLAKGVQFDVGAQCAQVSRVVLANRTEARNQNAHVSREAAR